mgnify:CR=1 FL=1
MKLPILKVTTDDTQRVFDLKSENETKYKNINKLITNTTAGLY